MYSLILVTCADTEQAGRIASSLVQERKAACVSFLDGVTSVYRWEGKVDTSREVLLLIKTNEALVDEVISRVKALHSYEVPEIVAVPITRGFGPYLRWIDDSCGEQR
jgi:periplasmic divalent cation tolerance protein